MTDPPEVAIILATRNGARYLPAQLATLEAQTVPWRLIISDDGSWDDTRKVAHDFSTKYRVHLIDGPRVGLAGANFLAALRHTAVPPGPVAFCDQDDLWYPNRLSDGLAALAGTEGQPALACAPVIPVDATGGRHMATARQIGTPSFGNALVQNVLCGSAMTLNAAAVAALRDDPAPPPLPFHDWWIYLRATAAGWPIHILSRPALAYRQHADNTLGFDHGIARKIRKAGRLWDGTWRTWRDDMLDALLALPEAALPPQARFAAAQLRHGTHRLRAWTASGAHRQGGAGQALMLGLAALNKV